MIMPYSVNNSLPFLLLRTYELAICINTQLLKTQEFIYLFIYLIRVLSYSITSAARPILCLGPFFTCQLINHNHTHL